MLLVTTASVIALAASPARAAGTLDQSHEDTSAGSGSIDLSPNVGQTFTAGITGALDQVDLALSRDAADATATVEIRTTTGGLPTDTVLASASVPTASIPTEPAFCLHRPGLGHRRHEGRRRLLRQRVPLPRREPGTYPRGDAVNFGVSGQWAFDDADLAFRTYVTQTAPPCKILRLPLPATPLTPPIVVCI